MLYPPMSPHIKKVNSLESNSTIIRKKGHAFLHDPSFFQLKIEMLVFHSHCNRLSDHNRRLYFNCFPLAEEECKDGAGGAKCSGKDE